MDTLAEEFLKAYYKAGNTSLPIDWMEAAMAAKRMYNAGRTEKMRDREAELRIDAAESFHKVMR